MTSSVDLEKTVQELRTQLTHSQQRADGFAKILDAHRQKHACETLYADGHVMDAAKSLVDITKSIDDDVKTDTIIMDWLPGKRPSWLGQGYSMIALRVYE